MYTKRKGNKRKGLKTKKRSIRHRHHSRCNHTKRTKRTNKVVKHKAMKRKTRKHKRRNLRKSKMMRGGMFSDNAGSYPDAYVPGEHSFDSGLRSLGNPYNAAVNGTPSGNHHPYNPYVKDPPIQSNTQKGGKKHNYKKKKQCGGGFLTKLMPEELVNVGRSVPAAFGNLADKFKGDIPHPSSKVYPTEQPHVYSSEDRGSLINPDTISIDDIKDIYNNANNEISGI